MIEQCSKNSVYQPETAIKRYPWEIFALQTALFVILVKDCSVLWHLFSLKCILYSFHQQTNKINNMYITKLQLLNVHIFHPLFPPKKNMRQLPTKKMRFVRGWNRSERFRFGLSHRREVRRRFGRSPSLAQACGRGSLWTRAWHPSATSGRGGHTSSTGCDSAIRNCWKPQWQNRLDLFRFQPVTKWLEKSRHWKLVTTWFDMAWYQTPGEVRCASFPRRDWLGGILNKIPSECQKQEAKLAQDRIPWPHSSSRMFKMLLLLIYPFKTCSNLVGNGVITPIDGLIKWVTGV